MSRAARSYAEKFAAEHKLALSSSVDPKGGTSTALGRWFYRTFLDHPKHDRFGVSEFVEELERTCVAVGRTSSSGHSETP